MSFAAPSPREDIRRFKMWRNHWQIGEPIAVKYLGKDIRECLAYYNLPKEQWKRIRTTSILERNFREVRRRSRPLGGTFVN